MKKKAIFLDRDGTIIVDVPYLNDPDQIHYLPKAFEALQNLRDIGFSFVIVTNQSGVPRGSVTLENLHEIHRRIRSEFSKHGVEFLDAYYAPHMPETNHPLRKPNPGMLIKAAEMHNIDLSQSWMIGDKLSDVEAGKKAGCRSLLLPNNLENDDTGSFEPEAQFESLWEASQYICSNS